MNPSSKEQTSIQHNIEAGSITFDTSLSEFLISGKDLSLQELEALAKMDLTKEEETKLSNYKGDINELVSTEKFVKEMLKIPFAFLRIEAMLYRETFEDEVIHLRKSFSMLEVRKTLEHYSIENHKNLH